MRPLTIAQWQTILGVQETLVEKGWHPSVAGQLVRRAVDRAFAPGGGLGVCCEYCPEGEPCEGGFGRIQMRSLRRDLDPTIKPRPVISGEQCIRIQEIPGDETRLYKQLDDYRGRGWNVLEVETTKGFPSVRVFWACPPGRLPMEGRSPILDSQPWAWGPPLYVNREKF